MITFISFVNELQVHGRLAHWLVLSFSLAFHLQCDLDAPSIVKTYHMGMYTCKAKNIMISPNPASVVIRLTGGMIAIGSPFPSIFALPALPSYPVHEYSWPR